LAEESGKGKKKPASLVNDMLRNLTEGREDQDAFDERKWKKSLKVKPFGYEGKPPTPPPLGKDGLIATKSKKKVE
jgi:hypothetical protein